MNRDKDNRPRTRSSRVSVTVGQTEGDFLGQDDRAIQAAIEYVRRLGGGTVIVGEGTWDMKCSLFLNEGIVLRGQGENTILRKAPSVTTELRREADWYESRVEVENAVGFAAGCGVMFQATQNGRLQVVREVVTRVAGNELHLSDRLMKNMWMREGATASTVFPIITADEETADVSVEDLVLDGNGEHNAFVNGNYTGGVFIQRCHRWTFRNVVSRNYSGDGFSFQVCDDIALEACSAEGNQNLGFHPGSGSQRPVFRNCTARGNSQGIFFCWGVSDGIVDACDCSHNRKYGISIGHRDTDNCIQDTRIEANGEVGILFRMPIDAFRGGHRTLIEANTLIDNGQDADGAAIDIQGATHDTRIVSNRFVDSGKGLQRVAVRRSPDAGNVEVEGNTLEGMSDLVSLVGVTKTEGG